jgi:hypothetical protein
MEMTGLPFAAVSVDEALAWFAFGVVVAFFSGMAFRGWWTSRRPHRPAPG